MFGPLYDNYSYEQLVALYLQHNPGVCEVYTLNATTSFSRLVWLDYVNRVPSPDHFLLLQYFIFSVFVVVLLAFLSYWVSPLTTFSEKGSTYECGFQPFGDARTSFDVHFYLVGILFLIFDLEVVYLFPWVFSYVVEFDFLYGNLPSMLFFIILLGVGFVYEWRQNALLWAPVTPLLNS